LLRALEARVRDDDPTLLPSDHDDTIGETATTDTDAPAKGCCRPPPPSPPPAKPSVPLTARELEVARLASQGLTNRQIAQRLGTSSRTVSNQLQAAYSKLGIHHRKHLEDRII
jgi:DNA-binding NarL/FixJ family response regulator